MNTSKIVGNDRFQRSMLITVLLFAALFLALTLSLPAYSHGLGVEKSAEALAATAEHKNRAKELTQQLRDLIAGYNAGTSSDLASQLAKLAEERSQILGELIENDPAEVLSQALPDDVLDQMPANTQPFLEQRTEMEGELQLLHVDYKDPSQSHYVYLLSTDKGERYSLHFNSDRADIQSSTRVRIHGVALYGIKARDAGETEGAVALDDADSSLQLLEAGGSTSTTSISTTTASLPNTLGAQKTLVILVNFQDSPMQPYTSADAQNVIFGKTSDFFLENSHQQTWLSGDVVGWYTLPMNSTVCDSSAIANYAKQAAISAGVDLSGYKRYLYTFPKNACGWWGLSGVGGNPSQSWINGDLELTVAAHELGHSLGLWHSHALYCGVDQTIGANCSSSEYGDTVDLMGSSATAHFNAFQKERLGWLNAGSSQDISTVLNDGTYILDAYESIESGAKALKILKTTDSVTGKKTWYYVEARKSMGFDSFLEYQTPQNILNGVIVHTGVEGNGNSSQLLDMTPETPYYQSWYDSALAVGERFEDLNAGITLSTIWVTDSQVAVTVEFGTMSGGGEAICGISTDKSIYTRKDTVVLTAKASSDGLPIANTSVTFTIIKANGKIQEGTATTGSNGVATYKLRLTTKDPIGLYQVKGIVNGTSGGSITEFTVK